MAKEIKLVAEERTVSGSAVARRLRGKGTIPGIVNDEKGRSTLIALDAHAFQMMLDRHVSESLIVDLQVGGKAPKKALLREVQHDPLTGHILHVDLLEVSMERKMRVHIPIVLVGDAAGVEEGGILEQLIREVEAECLPKDLVEEIEVDVSGLRIGHSIQVKDLKIGPELSILTAGEVAVASVLAPRLEVEEAPAEGEAAAAGAEPVVVREEHAKEGEGKGEGKKEPGKKEPGKKEPKKEPGK